MQHLILYDDTCPFCQKCIELALRWDHKKLFCFAPLKGKTAKNVLPKKFFHLNSLILIENFQSSSLTFHYRAKGVFRFFWLVGGKFKPLGILYFLPGVLINPFYRIVASIRFCLKKREINRKTDRFLK